jgi:hypothetical protein
MIEQHSAEEYSTVQRSTAQRGLAWDSRFIRSIAVTLGILKLPSVLFHHFSSNSAVTMSSSATRYSLSLLQEALSPASLPLSHNHLRLPPILSHACLPFCRKSVQRKYPRRVKVEWRNYRLMRRKIASTHCMRILSITLFTSLA